MEVKKSNWADDVDSEDADEDFGLEAAQAQAQKQAHKAK